MFSMFHNVFILPEKIWFHSCASKWGSSISKSQYKISTVRWMYIMNLPNTMKSFIIPWRKKRHLKLVNSLQICNFSQYLCTTFPKFKCIHVLMKIYHQDCSTIQWLEKKHDELHTHSQGHFPSVLRSWEIKMLNSSLVSIYVAQDSRMFCMNHNC